MGYKRQGMEWVWGACCVPRALQLGAGFGALGCHFMHMAGQESSAAGPSLLQKTLEQAWFDSAERTG